MSGVLAKEEYNRPSTLRVIKTFIEDMAFDVAADDPMVAVMVVVFSAAFYARRTPMSYVVLLATATNLYLQSRTTCRETISGVVTITRPPIGLRIGHSMSMSFWNRSTLLVGRCFATIRHMKQGLTH